MQQSSINKRNKIDTDIHPSNQTLSLGFLRLSQIIGNTKIHPPIHGLIPVSRSTFWAWVKSGKAPKPVKLSPGVTVWCADEIYIFIEKLKQGL